MSPLPALVWVAVAATFPNTTGTWKADLAQCEFVGPAPEEMTAKITDRDATYTVVVTETRNGAPRTVELRLDKTGKETVTKVGDMEVRTTLRIDGDVMHETAVFTTATGTFTRKATVRVSADGKTITKESVYSFPDGERRERIMLIKQAGL
jgi:hypothetical protein